MPDLIELSQDRRLRNHFNIDKRRRTNLHRQSSPHFHSYYELYYMEDGSCKFFLSGTVYNLERGDFFLVPPGEYHIVSYEVKAMHDRYTIYFDNFKMSAEILPYFTEFLAQIPPHFRVFHDKEEELHLLLERMISLYRLESSYGDLILTHLFQVFMLFLCKNSRPVKPLPEESPLETSLQAAAHYIGSHYSENITLEDAAKVAGFTATYFSRKFKEMVGIGFRDYVNHLRLKESTRLLRETSLSIQEISSRCGFTSSNYYGDVFRLAYGMSPRDYRKKEDSYDTVRNALS